MTSATPDSVDLTCREIVELVTDYLDGALPPKDLRDFESHLAECRYCRAYVEQMRATIELTGQPAPGDPPPPFREHLLDSFRDWKRGRP